MEDAGARAVIVAHDSSTAALPLEGWDDDLRIPAVQIGRANGSRLRTVLQGGQTVRVTFHVTADAWGFTRLADLAAPGGGRLTGALLSPNSDRFPAPDSGWYSVHNPFVVGDTLYLSHYSDGVRVWDLADPDNPVETARFVPPDLPDRYGRPMKTLVWGVYPDGDLVYASDIAHGLWILARDETVLPTQAASPTASPSANETPPPTATETSPPTEEPTEAPSPTPSPPEASPTPAETALPPPVGPTASATPESATPTPDAPPTPPEAPSRSPTPAAGYSAFLPLLLAPGPEPQPSR
jgi:hypothetical protein